MFCAIKATISGERLQDHWSSGIIWFLIDFSMPARLAQLVTCILT